MKAIFSFFDFGRILFANRYDAVVLSYQGEIIDLALNLKVSEEGARDDFGWLIRTMGLLLLPL